MELATVIEKYYQLISYVSLTRKSKDKSLSKKKKSIPTSSSTEVKKLSVVSVDQLHSIKDFQEAFPKVCEMLTTMYYDSGADDGYTTPKSREAFKRFGIRPRFLKDVSNCNLSTSIFGKEVTAPIGISQTELQSVAHPDGELATANAASRFGTIFIMNMKSTKSLQHVAEVTPNLRKWLQIPLVTREITLYMIEKAEKMGFEAIVLSVDTGILGKRNDLFKSNFQIRNMENYGEILRNEDAPTELLKFSDEYFEQCFTWDYIQYLKSITKLPIILKGIQTPEDAILAVENKADAIFVSNCDERQLGSCIPTLEVLPQISAAINKRVPILFDGGVTKGSDVFKALAVGADMVFVGQPIVWGLGIGGTKGVEKVLRIYEDELQKVMMLSGATSIKEINGKHIKHLAQ